MNVSKNQVLEDLRNMFSADQVVTQEDALKEYDSDNCVYAKSFGIYSHPLPICILNVFNKEEVAKALKYCNDNQVAVIPRTGGSSYEGLLTAVTENTIVLDASAMNEILKIDYENMYVTCQCGVPLATLEKLSSFYILRSVPEDLQK